MANLQRESAKIYVFPARGRFAVRTQHEFESSDVAMSRAVASGSWYHDEAIQQEAERARKN